MVNKRKKQVKLIRQKKRKILFRGGAKNGALYAIGILAVVAAFGGVMAGGVLPNVVSLKTPPPPGPSYTCCDSGDGPDCHPILEKQFTFNGDQYALLKSNIVVNELEHYAPTSQFTPDGHRIFMGTSNKTANYSQIPGCEQGKDLIRIWPPGSNFQTRTGKTCFGIPHGELIYVCKDTPDICNTMVKKSTSPFDVYYRLKDGPVPTELTSYCPKPSGTMSATGQQVIGVPTPGGKKNLQLEWFQVQQQQGAYEWDNQWCKPADYFYPLTKTDIHFDVKPQGNFTYTDPQYQPGGWNFTASPDGSLTYQNKPYSYIYWDAAIPNKLISEPSTGFVTAYTDLTGFLNNLLPSLGLNQKETSDFVAYWKKELPRSNYYFIGVIPQTEIDRLAPITIDPAPENLLRVTLYFKPQNKKTTVTPPQIAPFDRKGYTVIEWGAIFDTQKHPGFSCLM